VAIRGNIAVNGLLVPILVDEKRRVFDGNYRQATADELGSDCPFPIGGNSGAGHQHPAVTPYDLATWRCKYPLPPGASCSSRSAGGGGDSQ
jgi:hypothetical protein